MHAPPRSLFKHIALVGKYQSPGIRPVLAEIAEFLTATGAEVILESDTADNLDAAGYASLPLTRLGQPCDLAVVVGGDGTMLGIARELARHGVPLIGINHGRLGFVTDLPIGGWREPLTRMLAGEHEEDQRTMLAGEVRRDGMRIFEALAMNDVVVSRGATSGMVELRIMVSGELVANQRADGLIVASPTGSTAYALSAGGPILHPGVAGWVLTPIAPHTLSNRTIVLPDSTEIEVEIVSGKDASVNFDMHSLASLMHGDRILVRRSAHRVRFLHPVGWNYYATLRRKLHWNEGGS